MFSVHLAEPMLKPLGSYRSDPYTSKAWILPDGQAISIDRFHYQWILANGPLVREFGLRVEELLHEEDPVRIAAIKAGFYRVNFQIRDGHLTIEGVRTRHHQAIKEAIRELLQSNEKQLGRVTVNLFNDTVDAVVVHESWKDVATASAFFGGLNNDRTQ